MSDADILQHYRVSNSLWYIIGCDEMDRCHDYFNLFEPKYLCFVFFWKKRNLLFKLIYLEIVPFAQKPFPYYPNCGSIGKTIEDRRKFNQNSSYFYT